MKKKSHAEICTIIIGFAAAFILIGSMLHESSARPDRPGYIIIESDYGGDIVLDAESGVRYLRTDEGFREMEVGAAK